ncbi:histidinol-phosphate transaminase [Microbacterium dextranolyticum]|uniref:Histidinol-phosphate aminotransferase n=1 Tax=Microbacterium dextranolyticum TaxID=36806 RepID=A0A9W6HP24_9MICO|nr:histidinol-phosphate transaminase [Microbacterium dextranolyticum]MBM7462440.1 histidinol-phosphate aminotransferase [Microbacterium dextranolyticum]GLJ96727.1 histidinol-phosphate aminotransferase [Microbacterium dextranolyticum]
MSASLDDLPLRPDLRGLKPYGAPQAPLPVALNVNENTHPVPEDVADDIVDAIARAVREVNRYPDREFTVLREGFADYLGHGLAADQIWAANGSNEVLQHLLQAFGGPGRTAFGFAPTYSMYPLLTRATGAEYIAGTRGVDYTLDADDARRQIEQADPDLVFLCAPNNPTGTPLGLDVIEAVYEATDGIVIVDEAYQEFAPHDSRSALTLLPGRERLVVSRTMSKAFAFAGARVGYLAADPAVIDALHLVRLPYHLSGLTQAAAIAALRHAPAMLATVDEIVAQRDRISVTLDALGYEPFESWTNFVLFAGVDDPAATWQALYDQGVLIRDVGLPRSLRVTAGTEAESTAFLDALASLGPGGAHT